MAIDSFVAGGAQRQLILLDKYLSEYKHDVRFLIHNDKNFYEIPLDKIAHVKRGRLRRLGLYPSYVSKIINEKPDVIIAYGLNSALLCELSKIFVKFHLVVSERNLKPNSSFWLLHIRRLLHFLLADVIFVNSNAQLVDLNMKYPFLKVKLVKNTLSPEKYTYKKLPKETLPSELRVLGVGKYLSQKNILFLIDVISQLTKRFPTQKVLLRWFGDLDGKEKNEYFNKCVRKLDKKGIVSEVTFSAPTKDLSSQYRWASVFVLPSFSEGTPNVALEAMSAGLPICLSNVSDNNLLVNSGINGYLLGTSCTDDWVDALIAISRWNTQKYQSCQIENQEILNKFYGEQNLELISNMIEK